MTLEKQLAVELAEAVHTLLQQGDSRRFDEIVTLRGRWKGGNPDLMIALTGLASAVGFLAKDGLERTARIRALEVHVDELRRRPELKYCGVWSPRDTYQENALVTHSGGLWIAKISNISQRPGADVNHWQLTCKAGRDGRDGRDAAVQP